MISAPEKMTLCDLVSNINIPTYLQRRLSPYSWISCYLFVGQFLFCYFCTERLKLAVFCVTARNVEKRYHSERRQMKHSRDDGLCLYRCVCVCVCVRVFSFFFTSAWLCICLSAAGRCTALTWCRPAVWTTPRRCWQWWWWRCGTQTHNDVSTWNTIQSWFSY